MSRWVHVVRKKELTHTHHIIIEKTHHIKKSLVLSWKEKSSREIKLKLKKTKQMSKKSLVRKYNFGSWLIEKKDHIKHSKSDVPVATISLAGSKKKKKKTEKIF